MRTWKLAQSVCLLIVGELKKNSIFKNGLNVSMSVHLFVNYYLAMICKYQNNWEVLINHRGPNDAYERALVTWKQVYWNISEAKQIPLQ